MADAEDFLRTKARGAGARRRFGGAGFAAADWTPSRTGKGAVRRDRRRQLDGASEMKHANPCGVGNRIGATDGVQLFQQRCDMILGRVRGNAKATGNQLV